MGTAFNKTTIICFQCSKVFQQDTIVKLSFRKSFHIVRPSVNVVSHKSRIITDLSNIYPTKSSSQYTMKATHDVLYTRLNRSEALYVIYKIKENMRENIMKPIQKRRQMNMPSWESNYRSINGPSTTTSKKAAQKILTTFSGLSK